MIRQFYPKVLFSGFGPVWTNFHKDTTQCAVFQVNLGYPVLGRVAQRWNVGLWPVAGVLSLSCAQPVADG